ncbi:MAG: tRNA 2-selenouridine(34) synthase MnmH, partial [Caulobacteraceae bacterium]
ARNVALHLETALAEKPGGFRPLIYCWRGGQRSGAMATILAQVGWRTAVLAGGYKTYRRHVRERLYDAPLGLRVLTLDGNTGSGKTEIIARLAPLGVQAIDLEGLAQHRGSLFGGLAGRPQPGQKMFESHLLAALEALDPSRPVVVEAESSKIGDLMNPPALWRAMAEAPRVELVAPRAERARYLVRAYADIAADKNALAAALGRLPPRLGRKRLADLAAMADAGDFERLADALMELHYDPAYARSSRKDGRPLMARIELERLDEAALDQAARRIAALAGGDLSAG